MDIWSNNIIISELWFVVNTLYKHELFLQFPLADFYIKFLGGYLTKENNTETPLLKSFFLQFIGYSHFDAVK